MTEGGRPLYGFTRSSLAIIAGLSTALWSILIGIGWIISQAGS